MTVVDGLADEQLVAWVAQRRRDPGPGNRALGADALRAASAARRAARPPGPALAEVRDLSLPAAEELRVRLYRPTLEPRPLLVYLHGGGFVIGDLDSHDGLCRTIARDADATVLAVDYRRAPEHPAPAAVDDVVNAAAWAADHLDHLGASGESVALAGDSAGGALAVLAAVRLVDAGSPPVSALWLAYPNADLTLANPTIQAESGYGLDADDIAWFVEQWVPDPARRGEPDVSPLAADLRGLPPTLVVLPEHDPLRGEGEALVERLRQAGVDVRPRPQAGLVHGFLGLTQVSPAAAAATEALLADLRAMLCPA